MSARSLWRTLDVNTAVNAPATSAKDAKRTSASRRKPAGTEIAQCLGALLYVGLVLKDDHPSVGRRPPRKAVPIIETETSEFFRLSAPMDDHSDASSALKAKCYPVITAKCKARCIPLHAFD